MNSNTMIQKKRLFVTLTIAAIVESFRLYDPLGHFVDRLARSYLSQFPIWIVEGLFFLLLAGFLYIVFMSRFGDLMYDIWKRLEQHLSVFLAQTLNWRKSLYDEGERTQYEFKMDIRNSLGRSQSMFCLFATGYSVVYGEGRFLLDALNQLPSERLLRMDIRLLLLDRHSPAWMHRAQQVLHNDRNLATIGLEAYANLCESGELVIRTTLPNAKIAFYSDSPTWRLLIFDDRAFIQRYSNPEDPNFRSSSETPVIAINCSHPLYDWFCEEFKRLSPTSWQNYKKDLTSRSNL
jgi:hypothetical protein